MRALVFRGRSGYRVLGRYGTDLTPRFPELEGFAGLPPGTVLDGEVVVLRDGKPDLSLVQSRQKSESALRCRTSRSAHPVTFVAFDLLYTRYRSVMDEALEQRRGHLQETVVRLSHPHLVFSGVH